MLLLSHAAWAQQGSGIAGLVRDSSGAALPGVTVEAASPALIEKVRAVITDGEGRYNIVDLRPGTYTVTFSLPGFSGVRREGIAMNAGFTATVNADLPVGALEETITVSGEAPVVDTQNVRKQTVLSRELLDTLPTSTKSVNTLVTLTAGFTSMADVTGVYTNLPGDSTATFHGKSGTIMQFDGMGLQHAGGSQGVTANTAVAEEVVMQTSGISAESNADGAVINLIPKEGSNSLNGSLFALGTNDRFQGSNLTDKLQVRGLTAVPKVLRVYDLTGTFGGPIKKDRLWFFGELRWWGNAHQLGSIFWNKTQGTPFYTPDPARPFRGYEWYESKAIRLTWQASAKNKVNLFVDRQRNCNCIEVRGPATGVGDAPEATFLYHMNPQALYQGSWTSPMTNRLLLEGGIAVAMANFPSTMAPTVEQSHISILEQATGMRYNARVFYSPRSNNPRYTQRFAASYITGSHSFKGGIQVEEATNNVINRAQLGDVSYTFLNAVPVSLTQYATPFSLTNRTKADMGIYVQDKWAIKRLSFTYGLRFDYFNGYVPAQHLDATPNGWVPTRDFGEVKNVPLWKNWSPRLGGAYDLFGNGRTALKASIGRYVAKTATTIASANNPVNTSVNQVNRAWTDSNGNYIPDCDLKNRAANGECGAMSNLSFGAPNVTTRWADDVLLGQGARGYNWDLTAEVQHQLSAGMSMTAGYYRNWYGNFRATDNLAVESTDYSPYCITAPTNALLPNGGGYQVCGLYDINPNKFGQVNNLVTKASHFGKQKLINNFFNVGITSRLAAGAQFGAAVDTGRSTNDQCFVVDSPQQLLNCRIVTPFRGQTQIKGFGSYPLPRRFAVSAVYQNMSGPQITADYAASVAEIAPSLGRPLAGGARSAVVPLIKPQTQFEHRVSRLDLRVTKEVPLTSGLRLRANVDLYNIMNSSSILSLTTTYGPRWLRPIQIVDGRIAQFSAQLTF